MSILILEVRELGASTVTVLAAEKIIQAAAIKEFSDIRATQVIADTKLTAETNMMLPDMMISTFARVLAVQHLWELGH